MSSMVATSTGLDLGGHTPNGSSPILALAFNLLSATWQFVQTQSGQTVVRAIPEDERQKYALTSALQHIGISSQIRQSATTGTDSVRVDGQHTWVLRNFFTLATLGIGTSGVLYPFSAATQNGTYYFDTAQLKPVEKDKLTAHLGALGLSYDVHMSAVFSDRGARREVIRIPHPTQVSDTTQFLRIKAFMTVAGVMLLQKKEIVRLSDDRVGVTYPKILTIGQITAINSVLDLAGIPPQQTVLANGKTIPAGSSWLNSGENGYALIINKDYVDRFLSLMLDICVSCQGPKDILHFAPNCNIPNFPY